MKQRNADLLLGLASLIWGFGFIGVHMSLEAQVTPFQVLTGRFLLATVLLAVIFPREVRRLTLPAAKSGAILGVVLFLSFTAQTIGLQYTTPSKNAFITATNVIMVPFLYWMLQKQRPDGWSFAGAAVAMVGMTLLTLGEGITGFNLGDGLTLLCAVIFAFQIVYLGKAAREHSPVQLNFMQMLVAFLLSAICMGIEGAPIVWSAEGIFGVAYLGVMSTTVAFLLQSFGQKYTTATRAAIILSMESVFGTIFSVIFTGEILTPKMLLGCALMLLAVLITETKLAFLRKKEY